MKNRIIRYLSRLPVLLVFLGVTFFVLPQSVSAATTTCIWTNNGGAGDNNWNTASNWDCGSVPDNTKDVVINSSNNYPLTINTSATAASFTVSAGYTQTITANANLTLDIAQGGTGSFTLSAGTYNANSTTLTVPGSWNVASGTFGHGSSTVNFTASSAGKTITLGSNQFNSITFNGVSPGAWTLQDNLTATSLTLTTGNLIDNAKQVTINGSISIANTAGLLTSTGTWIQGASGNISNPSPTNTFKNLNIAGSGVTTTMAGNIWVGYLTGGTLTIGSGTLNGAAKTIYFYTSTSNALSIGNVTVGSSLASLWYVANAGTPNITQGALTIPNNFSTTVIFNLANSSRTLTATGDFNLGNNGIVVYSGSASEPTGYLDMDQYALTSGGVFIGASTFNGYLKLGSSATHSFSSITNYGTGAINKIDFEESTITVSGNVTLTNTALNAGSSTLLMTGSGTVTTNNQTFNNLTLKNTSGTNQSVIISGNLSVAGDLSVQTTGTGNETLNAATNNPTVSITGDVSYTKSSTGVPSISMGNGNWTVAGNIDLSNGTVTAGSSTLILTGNAAVITSNSQTLNNLRVSGTTATLGGALTLAGNLIIDSGKTLDTSLNNYAVTVAGNWANSGTYTGNNSLVTLNGTTQSISGSNTFYQLTSTTTDAARTLTFANGTTQTITNALTLTGTASYKLTLRSDDTPNQWNITPSGSRSVTYVDVKDSNNTVTDNNIVATFSTDSGNNDYWTITPPPINVTVQAATSITKTTATLNGNITDLGSSTPTERGFKVYSGTSCEGSILQTITETGTYSTGAYTGSIASLSPVTDYSYKAYATSATETSTSSCQSFTTIGPIYYITGASSIWVRGSISTTKDIAQLYSLVSTENSNIDFGTTYLIGPETENSVVGYTGGTLVANAADDSTPINTINANYLMEGHGLVVPVVTSIGHDKDSSDIGSTWSDGTNQFVLASISGNNITFYPKSYAYQSSWRMPTSITGSTLSHISDAIHSGSITVSSQVATQQYPIVKNLSRSILLNGTTSLSNGDEGYANYVDIVEEFDLVDPDTLVLTNNPFLWNDGEVWMHVKITYRATEGRTIVHSEYDIQRPMNVGYFGFIQTAALNSSAYDEIYYYIPKTKEISGYNFKSIQQFNSAPSSTLSFTSDYVDDLNNPPDRQIEFMKDTADTDFDIGFAFGYSPFGDSSASNRNCTSYSYGCWLIYTTRKTYPVLDGGIGIVDDVSYDVYAYRQWIDPEAYDLNKTAYWNTMNGRNLVYIDYHKSVANDPTTIPSEFNGYIVSLTDSENISLESNTVTDNTVVLSTTDDNTYGFAVLELTAPEPTPTPSPTSTPNTTSNTSNSSDSSPSAPTCGDQTPGVKAPWLYGAVAQNGNSILLYFTEADDPVDRYALEFGTSSGDYKHGSDNIGGKGLRTYLVQSLQPNTTYYFRIRGGNGCATGGWSNELSSTTKGLVSFNQLDFTESELQPVTTTEDVTEELVADSCQTYTVKSGDSLWSIATSELGDGNKYTEIIELNKEKYPSLATSNGVSTGWELDLGCDTPATQTEQEKAELEAIGGYSVVVKVTDKTQKPVEGAKVTIHSKVQEATTDKDGIAKFSNVEPGDHKVLIAYNNYEGEQSINLTGDVKEFKLNVTIQQKSVVTSPLFIGVVSGLVVLVITLSILLIRAKSKKS
jgi:hypothetical protein